MHNCSRIALLAAACFLTPLLKAADAPPLSSGINTAFLDATTRPGADFFQHANGNWLTTAAIPAEYSHWGVTGELRDQSLTSLRTLLDALLQKSDLDPERRKLRDLYRTALDEQAADAQGLAPIAPELAAIDAIQNTDDLVRVLSDLHANSIDAVFAFGVSPDEKQTQRYAVHIYQGGLALPEPSYYLEQSESAARIRAQYREHLEAMFRLMGDTPVHAAANAAAVHALETRLAEKSRTPVQLRDEEANYNKHSLAQLAALTPDFNWTTYAEVSGLQNIPHVIVGQPEFLERVNLLLRELPLAHWRAYLRFCLVHDLAFSLSAPFVNEDFRFFSKTLQGRQELSPRWKRAVNICNRNMGDALGKLYVEKHFPPAAKGRMDALVKNLLAAYRDRIHSRTWMGPDTQKQALAKLDTFVTKIGHPDRWRDYSSLAIEPDSLPRNILRTRRYHTRYWFDKLHKPVDRFEWFMTAPTVNAYYNTTFNEIVFPAGILQPPYFNLSADDAANYGAIGSIIGHEITHGFDDQGSRSDAQGNLRDWWTPDDRQRFTALTAKLVAQYNAATVLDTLRINGELTLGENIADLGGLAIAYDAYLKSLAGKPAPIIDGLTGPQRFFLGYAQSWRETSRPEHQRLLLRADPHSPPRFRVLIPLSNFTPFYEAFNLQPADPLYRKPEDRVEIW